MLTARQESTLTSGGDSFDHWHSSDRIKSHDDISAYQRLANVNAVSSDFTATTNTDFVIVDTSLGNIAVTLPPALNGKEIEVMKNAAANTLYIRPASLNLILGATELKVYNYGTSLRFKAINNGWICI